MRIFSRSTLLNFGRKYTDADQPLRAWCAEVTAVSWTNPAQIKARYPHASLIGNKRVVFNIGGNKYRLIVEVDYSHQAVLIQFIGTHKQYDKVDAETVAWNPKS
ncbi:MAG: type II toxin-antitoxin system HigB family toxin [Planctomycetaceae bacterium]|nr:type II toxin-antitoxin system HigB family toxin [Planctomycetaceae bacterium]